MSNIGIFIEVVCDHKNNCKSKKHFCKTCTRNRAIKLNDNFSLDGTPKSLIYPLDRYYHKRK